MYYRWSAVVLALVQVGLFIPVETCQSRKPLNQMQNFFCFTARAILDRCRQVPWIMSATTGGSCVVASWTVGGEINELDIDRLKLSGDELICSKGNCTHWMLMPAISTVVYPWRNRWYWLPPASTVLSLIVVFSVYFYFYFILFSFNNIDGTHINRNPVSWGQHMQESLPTHSVSNPLCTSSVFI